MENSNKSHENRQSIMHLVREWREEENSNTITKTDEPSVSEEKIVVTEVEQQDIRISDSMNGAELVNMGIAELPTLVEPLLLKTGLAALIGTSDIGKSTILLQLCCDVVLNDTFLNFNINSVHKSAIYVSTEDDQYMISKRLQRLRGQDKERLKNLRFMFDSSNIIKKLNDKLSEQGADLVVVDTFADIFDGQMNQINEVRRRMGEFQNLAQLHQCVIIFNHHTGKHTEEKPPSKNNSIGSAGFEGKARVVIELRQDYEDSYKKHLCIVKGNYLGSEHKERSYELNFDEDQVFTNTGNRKYFSELAKPKEVKALPQKDKLKQLVLRLHLKKRTVRRIVEILERLHFDISRGTVHNWIREMGVQQ